MIRKEKKKKWEEKWEMLRWITKYIDRNELEWENESQAEEMTEVERRMAVKPANPGPVVKTGDVKMDKAEIETSLTNTPEYTRQEDSKNGDNIQSELMAKMEMSVAKTPESDIEGMAEFKLHGGEESGKAELRSKVIDELEMSVANMPANVGTRTAKLTAKMQTGDESGTAEQESEVRKMRWR